LIDENGEKYLPLTKDNLIKFEKFQQKNGKNKLDESKLSQSIEQT